MVSQLRFHPYNLTYYQSPQPVKPRLHSNTEFDQIESDIRDEGLVICHLFSLEQLILEKKVSHELLMDSLQRYIGHYEFRILCEAVALGAENVKNASRGEKLLIQDPFHLFRISNKNGRNLFNQICDYHIKRKDNLIAQEGLRYLKNSVTKWTESQSRLRYNQIRPFFDDLSEKAKSTICYKIWEIDDRPKKPEHGKNTILENFGRLVYYKNHKPLDETLASLNHDPFYLTVDYVEPNGLSAFDSVATIPDLQKYSSLRGFNSVLEDFSKDNNTLFTHFETLPSDLKKLIYELVWMAHVKPQGYDDFAKRLLEHDTRSLLRMQNQNGSHIISQLMTHYRNKIALRRLEDRIRAFIKTSNNSLPSAFLTKLANSRLDTDEFLSHAIWYLDGGYKDRNFGGMNYGTNQIKGHLAFGKDIFLQFLGKQANAIKTYYSTADSHLLQDFNQAFDLSNPIEVSMDNLVKTDSLIKNHLPDKHRDVFIASELAHVASVGGLGAAIEGMVQGMKANNKAAKDVRVILPLYREGPINDAIIKQMKETDYTVFAEGKQLPIFKATIHGISCYFIAQQEGLFHIHRKNDGSVGNFYEDGYDWEKYDRQRHRWAVFQKGAAELAYAFSKKKHPFELIHVHDAQTALIPKILQHSHPQEWVEGKTPATVFTFHNTAEPMEYHEDRTGYLENIGLPRQPANSFIEGLNAADMVTTVSKTFAKEAQMKEPRIFGNGMHDAIRKVAAQGKFYGIINGITNYWKPTENSVLANWQSALHKDMVKNLQYGPHMDAITLAKHKKECQEELCTYLQNLHLDNPAHANLDPKKPIFAYIGRLDSQKGIDKMLIAMREILPEGQFVCIGTDPNEECRRYLNEMAMIARRDYGNKGTLFLVDTKVNGSYLHQSKFGPLLRACATGVYISSYEPCGLGHQEFARMGEDVIATNTGGHTDTVIEGFNGFLAKRLPNWNSPEQDEEIRKAVRRAVNKAVQEQNALNTSPKAAIPFMEHRRAIMADALKRTWTTTPDNNTLSPIRQLELVYAEAFRRRKNRGITPTELAICYV